MRTIEDGDASGSFSPSGIATDTAGNLYVTGRIVGGAAVLDGVSGSGQDLFLSKYDASGVRQWTIRDGKVGGWTIPTGVAVDSAGYIYVTGTTGVGLGGNSFNPADGLDLFLTKFDSNGSRKWTIQDGSPANSGVGQTSASAIIIDKNDNIYIAGTALNSLDGQPRIGVIDAFLSKYRTDGTRQWTVKDGASGFLELVGSLALDGAGNVILAGSISANTNPPINKLLIAKFDSSGVRQWEAQDGAAGTTEAYGVATDSAGNIFVTGYSLGDLDVQPPPGTNPQPNFFVTGYGSDGTRKWTVNDHDNGPAGKAIAVDSNDRIYAVGFRAGSQFNPNKSSTTLLKQLDTAGNVLGSITEGGSGATYPTALSLDALTGQIYVAGVTNIGLGSNVLKSTGVVSTDYFVSTFVLGN